MDVHDVNGADFKDPDPGGGILSSRLGRRRTDPLRRRTDRGLGRRRVDRTAIGTSSTWGRRPRPGSPAIGAGLPVAEGVVRDFFGNRIPTPPNVGADQGRRGRAPDAAAGHGAGGS
ncbi:hypothetical protein [Streptomyces sp. NPDC019539]|uniref:hypothetical protein n=1 Tax=Streptomyces sp. NPDC019539 TaxID=3365063 RepID=UPI00379ECFAD